MSSAKQIVHDLSELVRSVGDLMQTETARRAPKLAVELGAEEQLNGAIDILHGLLQQIQSGVGVIRDPLLHIGAMSGLLGLIGPFVNAFGQLTATSGEQLAQIGLGDVEGLTGHISAAVTQGSRLLQEGQQVMDDLPSVQDVDALLANLADLAGDLLALKAVPLPQQAAA